MGASCMIHILDIVDIIILQQKFFFSVSPSLPLSKHICSKSCPEALWQLFPIRSEKTVPACFPKDPLGRRTRFFLSYNTTSLVYPLPSPPPHGFHFQPTSAFTAFTLHCLVSCFLRIFANNRAIRENPSTRVLVTSSSHTIPYFPTNTTSGHTMENWCTTN